MSDPTASQPSIERRSLFVFDALLPTEMAEKAEEMGVKKATLDTVGKMGLAVLAGAFIAFGAVFFTTVVTGAESMPWGVARMLGGLAFCLGLILVVIGGAELYTGNNLLVMAWASRRITTRLLLRNWTIVYIGNVIGSIGIAILVFGAQHHVLNGGAVGAKALAIGMSKVHMPFMVALTRGILCNTLVCLAVWLTLSTRTTMGRVLTIIFPITAFVAAGFEHCVANMYFVPIALFIKDFASPAFWTASGLDVANFADLTWQAFIVKNLIPVTIGNTLGGGILVGAVYWVIYSCKHLRSVPNNPKA